MASAPVDAVADTGDDAMSLDGSRVLYLSYDGLTDPLGQSQVLPYLEGLARRGCIIDLITFDKPDRLAAAGDTLRAQTAEKGIRWWPLTYTKRPPVVSTVYDVVRMRRMADRLQARSGFDLVHCRSYISALVGLHLKRKHGVRFLFDMRGFWADEKIEDGSWRQEKSIYRAVYTFFKKREARFFAEADGIVSLTDAGKRVMEEWPSERTVRAPVAVIPCSADFDLFDIPGADARATARKKMGVSDAGIVLAYVGSVGAWYLLDEMLEFFKVLSARHDGSRFLFITPSDPAQVIARARAVGVDPAALSITRATRAEVPLELAAADVGISFIRRSFSKKSSSPTKVGEYLAMGLPVVANAGVGDMDAILGETGGIVLEALDRGGYAEAVDALPGLLATPRHVIRSRARKFYDLGTAVDRYAAMYSRLLER